MDMGGSGIAGGIGEGSLVSCIPGRRWLAGLEEDRALRGCAWRFSCSGVGRADGLNEFLRGDELCDCGRLLLPGGVDSVRETIGR